MYPRSCRWRWFCLEHLSMWSPIFLFNVSKLVFRVVFNWDLSINQSDGHEPGWKAVPTDDPEVQDAANHAVKSIQKRSNSLSPYELLEVLLAKAKVGILYYYLSYLDFLLYILMEPSSSKPLIFNIPHSMGLFFFFWLKEFDFVKCMPFKINGSYYYY